MIGILIATADAGSPAVQLIIDGEGSGAIKMLFLLTALSFAPAALLSLTSFTRIMVVLSFLRQAMGTTTTPPNQVIVGLALFLTLFTMNSTINSVYEEGLKPYFDGDFSSKEAFEAASDPIREFMLQHTRVEDIRLFYEISDMKRPMSGDAIPMSVLIPAFMISELTTAFRIALFIFIPFVMIDLLVAALSMSLGMIMLPPVMISLPLKLGVFLAADGWHQVVLSLVRSV